MGPEAVVRGEAKGGGVRFDLAAEWLETDGLGGFASGTVGGTRTRRYHALLLAAARPPGDRFVLVNGLEAWVEREGASTALSTQRYLPGVRHPDGEERIVSFEPEPWPTWRFRLDDGTEIVHEVTVAPGAPRTLLSWRLARRRRGVRLFVRPLLSGRDYHGLHRENPDFGFQPEREGDALIWRAYPGVPAVALRANGSFRGEPLWYRRFLYQEERARGLDHGEDLASPGALEFELGRSEAVCVLEARTEGGSVPPLPSASTLLASVRAARTAERRRRRAFPARLERAGDAYLVRRGTGKTVVAGYPWFTDWGRDTFIGLRGLCLATGRLEEAGAILGEWAGAVSEGMLPNRFPDRGEAPEYNSVDASLWYVVAVHEWLEACRAADRRVAPDERAALEAAVRAILSGYAEGTRYGIRSDSDGLLAAGVPGQQLTWMDARIGGWVVTPRIGKPVEVQALWLNALRIGGRLDPRWIELHERAAAAFADRFWNPASGCLFDVVDVEHRTGEVDAALRPNQILAVGGLPYPALEGERARAVVDAVEGHLLTPLGLRSLAPGEPGYAPRYSGGVWERDGAYHQGTVWPWLIGPFVEAWVRVRGASRAVKAEARERFLAPLLAHLEAAGLGHISEVADAEPPHRPGGCPFQAWSVGEALRLDRVVLDAGERGGGRAGRGDPGGRGATGGRRGRRKGGGR